MIATVNTLTDVLEKDRKILGRLCQAVVRWESEEKEGKGPWAFHTRVVSGIHEAQVQAQGEARKAQPGRFAVLPVAAASPLPAKAPPPFVFAAPSCLPSSPAPVLSPPVPLVTASVQHTVHNLSRGNGV